MGMLCGTRYLSKKQWKDKIWKRACEIEDQDCGIRAALFRSTINLRNAKERVNLIWWQLGDLAPEMMQQCKMMVKLLCKASKLKSDSCNLYRYVPSYSSP